MRHLKLTGMSVIAAAALAGFTVSAAAATPRLAILEPNTATPAPNGYPNVASVVFVPNPSPVIVCEQVTAGTLSNDRPTDRDTLSGPSNDICAELASGNVLPAPGYSMTGGFSRIAMSWTGFSELTGGTATVGEPGPCVYKFHNLHGFLPGLGLFTSGQVAVEGQADGALDRAESRITCAQSQSLRFFALLTSVGPSFILNAEVRG
jgi:hypothetical protein